MSAMGAPLCSTLPYPFVFYVFLVTSWYSWAGGVVGVYFAYPRFPWWGWHVWDDWDAAWARCCSSPERTVAVPTARACSKSLTGDTMTFSCRKERMRLWCSLRKLRIRWYFVEAPGTSVFEGFYPRVVGVNEVLKNVGFTVVISVLQWWCGFCRCGDGFRWFWKNKNYVNIVGFSTVTSLQMRRKYIPRLELVKKWSYIVSFLQAIEPNDRLAQN